MPNGKVLCVDDIRHSEYYDMQNVFDDLYSRSKQGEIFEDLISLIAMRENILLAYRNIKNNEGSNTPGTDGLCLKDIGKMSENEVIENVRKYMLNSQHGYRPKPVRRKEIPKPNGGIRPLGIPCVWDRLIQQCIKQVMEPICEAKFSNYSYGFRPLRSVEKAIQRSYQLMQNANLHYVVEFDIKGFFDNVDHSKLIKQIWALGIRDKQLIFIIRRILKAPIKLETGECVAPYKGTPQGGIISPLLANIVLNELDQWVDSQWTNNPVINRYAKDRGTKGIDKSHGYRAARNTNLKEIYIVRYADDFRIFCRTRNQADRIYHATTEWLEKRLKLEVSREKTRIRNTEKQYMDFLGFKMKVHKKGKNFVVRSQIEDKARKRITENLKEQIRRIEKPTVGKTDRDEVVRYNLMVMGIQEYYSIATHISVDFRDIAYSVNKTMNARLGDRLKKSGRVLSQTEKSKFGKSTAIRYLASTGDPIFPISYVQHRNPVANKRKACVYTAEGRELIHRALNINKSLLYKLMKNPIKSESIEYNDNRISKFSSQLGKCAISGYEFTNTTEIHCHHKIPRSLGGTDDYDNLIIVTDIIHKLIHAKNDETIKYYLKTTCLNKKQIEKLNELRKYCGNKEILITGQQQTIG